MNNDKKNILGKDVHWYIGYTEDFKKIVVLPYIYNKEKTSIKVLTDEKIYNIESLSVFSCFNKEYKTNTHDFFDFNSDEKDFGLPCGLRYDEIFTKKKMNEIKIYLTKLYNKDLTKIEKNSNESNTINSIRQQIINFEDVYLNGKKIIGYTNDIMWIVGSFMDYSQSQSIRYEIIPVIQGKGLHDYKNLNNQEIVHIDTGNGMDLRDLAKYYDLKLRRTYCLGQVVPMSHFLYNVKGYKLDKFITKKDLIKIKKLLIRHYLRDLRKKEIETLQP